MPPKKTTTPRRNNKAGIFACVFLALVTFSWAQPAGTGTVRGQVLNESTGNYLNNARVAVRGTAIETYTTATGAYWLANVPAGEAVIEASFTGLDSQRATVTVASGGITAQDFALSVAGEYRDGKLVQLEPMSVTATMLSGQAVALAEQRNAANIKNVISPDEFVDQAEGNIGEFLKFVPGLDITYNPFNAGGVTIRGMPASGTLIQFDGMPTAPALSGRGRTFDLNTAANANIERIEISKVPTPEMPANAVGGSINVISKSGFSRKTPLFSYNAYMTYSAMEGEFDPSFHKVAGADGLTNKRPVGLAYDLSYILPLNKSLGFTFALTRAPRYNPVEYRSPTFNTNTGILAAYQNNELTSGVDIQTAKVTVDWKLGQYSTIQASYYDMDRRSFTRQHISQFNPGAGATGDDTFVQGAATGVGTAAQNLSGNQQYRTLSVASLKYRYEGPIWRMDAFASLSKGGADFKDTADGFFGSMASNRTGLVIRADGLDRLRQRGILDLAVTRAGVPIDILDSTEFSINTVSSAATSSKNTTSSYGLNVSREMSWAIPTRFKIGYYSEIMQRDNQGTAATWTFTPPGGAAGRIAKNFDVFNDAFSQESPLTEPGGRAVYARYMSLAKLYALYQQNPSWFVLNEATAHQNRVEDSIEIKETVNAAYVRMDNHFFDNKLWLVAGVRWEGTKDDGRGPLNNIGAIYQRDAAGNFVRDSQGQLIRITTNALEIAKLRYVERGFAKETSYNDFYPSLNASYSFSDHMVLRAGYARTIGRPDLDQIIPSVVVTDPNLDATTRRITLVDGNLKPWTADNFDLTFEIYDIKGATASMSLFQKNIENFFAASESEVTPADLDELGLPADYNDYIIRRTVNKGKAELSGIELSYRQTLDFIPVIGRRIQVFGNLTSLTLDGDNPQDFEAFSPRNINAGIGYVHPRFSIKLNMQSSKWVRSALAATNANNGSGNYNYVGPVTRWDFSAQYRINKWLSIYYSVRNLTAEPKFLEIRGDTVPEYARSRNLQFVGANHTLGIKGSF